MRAQSSCSSWNDLVVTAVVTHFFAFKPTNLITFHIQLVATYQLTPSLCIEIKRNKNNKFQWIPYQRTPNSNTHMNVYEQRYEILEIHAGLQNKILMGNTVAT